jgi:hypothetical protein
MDIAAAQITNSSTVEAVMLPGGCLVLLHATCRCYPGGSDLLTTGCCIEMLWAMGKEATLFGWALLVLEAQRCNILRSPAGPMPAELR